MKIAILSTYFYHEVKEVTGRDRIIFGGGERYLIELCKFLQAEGNEVAVYQPLPQTTVVDGRQVRVPCGQIAKEYEGIPIICLPDTDGGWNLMVNPDLNMIFNEIGTFFDLRIYFATYMAFPQAVLPAISISHGIYWDYPQGLFKSLNDDGRKEFFRRHLYGFTTPDVCVAVDSNVRKVIAATEPGAESRIHVVPNFVDTKQFTPAPEKTWEGTNVLYPRRLTQLRGCNDFIKASQDFPQYNYLAVGQNSREETEKNVSAWYENTPHLNFIHKPMDEMPEIYRQADISVVPTKACEGLSLSLLESMACALPVITTPVGGIGDGVIDGYNALIYDPNHDDLGFFIDALAKDEGLRQKFGQRNREIAVESFDIKIWHQRWKNILRSFGA